MDNDGLATLTDQLRDRPPAGIAGLASEHQTHLSDALRAARRHQAAELQRASNKALEHIPRLLRGPVKKIVG